MSCPKFIAQAFAMRTAAHLAHLSTGSYARHMALGSFYDALLTLTDRYAETYMGLNKQMKSFPSVQTPTGDPVDMLEDFLATVQAEQAEDEETSEALENILSEIEELTATTIYKLRDLK